jgi:hypothetical protein
MPGMEDIVALRNTKGVNRKKQLTTKEMMQLTLWGGLLLIILLGLVYGLVRAGAIIPVNNGVAQHAAETPVSQR